MKILIVGPFGNKGRTAGGMVVFLNSLIPLFPRLQKDGFSCFALSTNVIQRSDRTSGKFRIRNLANFFKLKKELTRSLAENESDVVFYQTSVKLGFIKDLLVVSPILKSRKVLLEIHSCDIHSLLVDQPIIRSFVLKKLTSRNLYISVLSSGMKGDLIKAGISESHIFLLRNFVDPSPAVTAPISVNEKVNFIYMGMINYAKGILDLLSYIQNIPSDLFELTVCGSAMTNSDFDSLQKFKSVLGPNVHFAGFVQGDKKDEMLRSSDILILPSRTEGMPMCILEACSYGLGVISTDVGGISDIIDEKCSVLVDPGDFKSFALAMEKLASNKKLVNSMKHNAFTRAPLFSKDRFIVEFENILKTIGYNGYGK